MFALVWVTNANPNQAELELNKTIMIKMTQI